MEALVLKADKVLEYMEMPEPERLGPDSVLVRVAYCGICNSDLKRGFHGGAYRYPLIMGHELSGIVEESFPGSRYRPGDRVTAYPLLPCRRCAACQSGDYAQCQDYDYFGSRRHGGFAERLYVPEANLLPIPEGVELLHAALTEPCAVALHAVNRLDVRPGHTAAVIGAGPIGNLAAQWLRIRGCSRVFLADVEERPLELARNMGFLPIDSRREDPVASIRRQNGGAGADLVIEACGLPQTFLQAVQAAGVFGEVLFLGNIRGQFVIGEKDFSAILRRELKILGSWNSRLLPEGGNDWSTALRYMGEGLQVAPLITHVLELAEGPQAFRRIDEGSFGSHGRVVLRVGN